MARTVLLLEDDAARVARFRAVLLALDPAAAIITWSDAHTMIREVGAALPTAKLISLDHDLYAPKGSDAEPGDGLDVARHLATLTPTCPIIVHSSNYDRAWTMIQEVRDGGWRVEKVSPIGDDWIETTWRTKVAGLLNHGHG